MRGGHEDGVGAARVGEVAVLAAPVAIAVKLEAALQEEGVGPGLAAARDPLAAGRHRQQGAARQARRRRGRRRRVAHALARLATQHLGKDGAAMYIPQYFVS